MQMLVPMGEDIMTATDATARLPLAGIRVLDFTHAAAGPFATMLLADMGAEVFKIEKAGRGDGARHMGIPMFGKLESDYYLSINRNKRGLALDLRSPRGRDIALKLAEHCDIVVQNFRPGVMERLGLGFADIAPRRRGIIYGSISAFGAKGPMSDRPANDIIMQSVSGLMGVTGEMGGGPVRVGAPISDYATGLFCLVGLLSALHVRDQHPEGQHIEISMLDSSIALMANYIPSVVALGVRIPRLGRAHAQIVPYQAFECSDGSYIMVGAFTNAFWRRLCEALGHPEWAEDERFKTNADRLRNRDLLLPMISDLFLKRSRQECQAILDAADVPNSPVLELNETLELEQVKVNETIQYVGESDVRCPTVRLPIRSSAWPPSPSSMPPRIGQDSFAILKGILGLEVEEIEALIAEGVTAVADDAVDHTSA